MELAPTLEPPSSRSSGTSLRHWPVIFWAAAFLVVGATLQCHTGAPLDADTAYHVAVGRLIRAHGILHAFPWTPFSWLANHYADKELAFHLALAAVGNLPWITAARIVGALWGAAALLALFLILRAERVRWPGLWALLPLCASTVFLFRFVLVRPHVASIALAPVVLWACVRRRLVIVALVSALYPWFYVGWTLAVAMAVIAEVARAVTRERPTLTPIAVVLGGVVVGIALHPNAANLVRFTWIQSVDVLLRGAWGGDAVLELGDEFRAFSAGEWAKWLLGAAGAAAVGAALSWPSRDVMTRAFSIAALCFCAMTLRTARFAEYFVPFSIVALALGSRTVRWRWFPVAAAAALALYATPTTAKFLDDAAQATEDLPPAVGAQLAAAIPPGSQVFTCGWGHTGTMMLALPERRFIVALDPTFFYVNDPDLYRLWYSLPRAPPGHPAAIIREKFGARFVVCRYDDRFRRFFNRLATDGDTRPLTVAEGWEAYDLGG